MLEGQIPHVCFRFLGVYPISDGSIGTASFLSASAPMLDKLDKLGVHRGCYLDITVSAVLFQALGTSIFKVSRSRKARKG